MGRNFSFYLKNKVDMVKSAFDAEKQIRQCVYCSPSMSEIDECAGRGHNTGVVPDLGSFGKKVKFMKGALREIEHCSFCSERLDKILRHSKIGHVQ